MIFRACGAPGTISSGAITGHLGEFRAAERIDEHAEAESLLDEALHPRAGAALSPVAEADDDAVAGIEITVDDVDDNRLLERPLVALLIEAHLQCLHRRRALTGQRAVPRDIPPRR